MSFKESIKKIPIAINGYHTYIKIWNILFRKQNVTMMHIGRVGSIVLGDMMNQDPKICWDGEPFEILLVSGSNKPKDFVEKIIKESRNKLVTPSILFCH